MKNTSVQNGFIGFVNLAAIFFLFGNIAHSAPPACLGNSGAVLPVNDDQVLGWKTSTPNETLERAHVTGIIDKVYPNATGHAHFSIKMGDAANDTLEVIYNLSFGALQNVAVGMQVEACGDFINSFKAGGGYQASPDGAIIHWIHKSTSRNHEGGFLEINGTLYGEGNGSGA